MTRMERVHIGMDKYTEIQYVQQQKKCFAVCVKMSTINVCT